MEGYLQAWYGEGGTRDAAAPMRDVMGRMPGLAAGEPADAGRARPGGDRAAVGMVGSGAPAGGPGDRVGEVVRAR